MPGIPETLQAGLAHHRAGRLPQAEQLYRRVLEMHPRHAGAIHLLGLIAFQIGQHDAAVQYLSQAIKLDSFQPAFSADLGEIYRAQGKTADAIAAYRRALALNPKLADAHNNLGTLLAADNQAAEAAQCFREALRLNPGHADAHGNLGSLLEADGRLADARAAYESAVQMAPESAQAYLNLGGCLSVAGDWHGAMACFQKAARLDPQAVEPRYQAALARLALGDFANGWREFEWRSKRGAPARRTFDLPTWNGAELSGHRVLIHSEQVLGDTLQFIRYVPLASARGAEPILDVPPRLITLLRESGFTNLIAPDEPPPECHLQAPLLSLPGLLGTVLETIPAQIPYLSAGPELVAEWHDKLVSIDGFKIGIAWQGDAAHPRDRFRSIPLADFELLARVAGVRLISLQMKDGLDQLANLAGRFEVNDFGDKLDTAAGAFMDTAAIMKNLDLVVTADTAAAHLAGALGARVWVALSTAADWRWLRERDDSPWYPTMRLFRQTATGDWVDVFRRMAAAVEPLVVAAR
jgi:Tfp pilus assembly protein PilF